MWPLRRRIASTQPNCASLPIYLDRLAWRADQLPEILDGKVNVLHCRKCGNPANIVTDLLYHDMEEHFWVQYLPFEQAMSTNLAGGLLAQSQVMGGC